MGEFLGCYPDHPHREDVFVATCPLRCNVQLNGVELWRKFNNHDTEMIITNNGRRMFPTINITVSDLQPNTMYCMLIYFEQVGNCREKYNTTSGWSPAGSSDAQNPNRTYIHPRSPAKGSEWMSGTVSFSKLKLTNKIPSMNQPLELGHVVLSSMHRYQPKIFIIECDDRQQCYSTMSYTKPTRVIVFRELCFVAVTAYQNQEITKLKVENNPFAKGFKENGKSYAKRKRRQEQQQQEKLIENGNQSARSSPEIEVDDPPPARLQLSDHPSSLQYVPPIYPYDYRQFHPVYAPYWYHHSYFYYQQHSQRSDLRAISPNLPQDLVVRTVESPQKKERVLSEFTIDAILRK